MKKTTICIVLFTGEKETWRIWSRKFMTMYGINRFDVLLTGEKNLADYTGKTKEKGVSELKLFNKTDYNKLILTKEVTVYF